MKKQQRRQEERRKPEQEMIEQSWSMSIIYNYLIFIFVFNTYIGCICVDICMYIYFLIASLRSQQTR